jgi:hypothetical protein
LMVSIPRESILEIEPKSTAIMKDPPCSYKARSIIYTTSSLLCLQPANAYETPCALSFQNTVHLLSLICRFGTVHQNLLPSCLQWACRSSDDFLAFVFHLA